VSEIPEPNAAEYADAFLIHEALFVRPMERYLNRPGPGDRAAANQAYAQWSIDIGQGFADIVEHAVTTGAVVPLHLAEARMLWCAEAYGDTDNERQPWAP
jgi:hypothetical protein